MTNAFDNQDQQQDPGLSFSWTPRNWWSLQRVAERAPQAERPAAPTSFGLPPGQTGPYGQAPFRASPQQLYIPSAANRDGAEWGRPPQYPMQPQAWQIPGIFRGLGQQLSQWGSAGVAPAAARLFQSTGAYTVNFAKGQLLGMQMQHQKMVNDALALQNQLQKELMTYGEISQLYDPKDPAQQDKYRELLRHAAHNFGDDTLRNALDTNDLVGAEKYLKWLDKNFADTHTSVAQQLRIEEIHNAENPYRLNPTNADGSPATNVNPSDLETPTPPPASPQPAAQPSPAAPAPAAGPSESTAPDGGPSPEPPTLDLPTGNESDAAPTVPAQSEQAAAEAPSAPAPPAAQDQQRLPQVAEAASDLPEPGLAGLRMQATPEEIAQAQTPAAAPPRESPLPQSPALDAARQAGWDPRSINQIAQQMLLGTWREAGNKNIPNVVNAARRRYLEMNNQLDQILTNQNLKGDDVISAVRNISPSLASDITALKNGAVAPPRGYNLGRPPWDKIYPLVLKADPTMTPAAFANRARTMIDFASGYDGRNVTAIATAYRHLQSAIDAVRNQPPWILQEMSRGIPYVPGSRRLGGYAADELDALFGGKGDVSTRLGQLDNRVNTAIAEYERALTGGKPTVTGRAEQEEKLDVTNMPPARVVANLQDKIDRLAERMDENKQRYLDGTNLDPREMLKLFDPQIRDDLIGLDRASRPVQRIPSGVTIEEEQ